MRRALIFGREAMLAEAWIVWREQGVEERLAIEVIVEIGAPDRILDEWTEEKRESKWSMSKDAHGRRYYFSDKGQVQVTPPAGFAPIEGRIPLAETLSTKRPPWQSLEPPLIVKRAMEASNRRKRDMALNSQKFLAQRENNLRHSFHHWLTSYRTQLDGMIAKQKEDFEKSRADLAKALKSVSAKAFYRWRGQVTTRNTVTGANIDAFNYYMTEHFCWWQEMSRLEEHIESGILLGKDRYVKNVMGKAMSILYKNLEAGCTVRERLALCAEFWENTGVSGAIWWWRRYCFRVHKEMNQARMKRSRRQWRRMNLTLGVMTWRAQTVKFVRLRRLWMGRDPLSHYRGTDAMQVRSILLLKARRSLVLIRDNIKPERRKRRMMLKALSHRIHIFEPVVRVLLIHWCKVAYNRYAFRVALQKALILYTDPKKGPLDGSIGFWNRIYLRHMTYKWKRYRKTNAKEEAMLDKHRGEVWGIAIKHKKEHYWEVLTSWRRLTKIVDRLRLEKAELWGKAGENRSRLERIQVTVYMESWSLISLSLKKEQRRDLACVMYDNLWLQERKASAIHWFKWSSGRVARFNLAQEHLECRSKMRVVKIMKSRGKILRKYESGEGLLRRRPLKLWLQFKKRGVRADISLEMGIKKLRRAWVHAWRASALESSHLVMSQKLAIKHGRKAVLQRSLPAWKERLFQEETERQVTSEAVKVYEKKSLASGWGKLVSQEVEQQRGNMRMAMVYERRREMRMAHQDWVSTWWETNSRRGKLEAYARRVELNRYEDSLAVWGPYAAWQPRWKKMKALALEWYVESTYTRVLRNMSKKKQRELVQAELLLHMDEYRGLMSLELWRMWTAHIVHRRTASRAAIGYCVATQKIQVLSHWLLRCGLLRLASEDGKWRWRSVVSPIAHAITNETDLDFDSSTIMRELERKIQEHGEALAWRHQDGLHVLTNDESDMDGPWSPPPA